MAILSKSLESSKSPKDTTWGSFSNRAPWNLNEQECLDFDAKTNEIRAEVHYEASKLLEKTFCANWQNDSSCIENWCSCFKLVYI